MEQRFSGILSEEYCLFELACPYFSEMRMQIKEIVKNHCQHYAQEKIAVLEIGFGLGPTTSFLLNSEPHILVTAIDNEPKMVEQAKENLKNFIKAGRLKLIEEDALQFLQSVASNSFEACVSSFTIHNFEQDYRNKLLKEIYRILKSNGLFVNADKCASNNAAEHKAALEWQLEQYKKVFEKKELVSEWIAHDLEDEKESRILREKQFLEQLKKIGFKEVNKIFRKRLHATVTATK
ncbi:methyltransferase domain-containing protein [Candidatus Micrarchaeota archaeon]|nr:methyltransferase domain-containing protein [Candidatus Micrarchaeota archaeon]MBU1931061.1 methyltransferase domain-containing protein [Candidatus Micrarchaeota archaeon]